MTVPSRVHVNFTLPWPQYVSCTPALNAEEQSEISGVGPRSTSRAAAFEETPVVGFFTAIGLAERPGLPPFERMTAFASSLSVGKTMSAVSRCSGSSAPTPHGFQTCTSMQAMVNIFGERDVFTCATSAVAAAGVAAAGGAVLVEAAALCDPTPFKVSDPIGFASLFETPPTV